VKLRIAILTPLDKWDNSYSLCSVIQSQLVALVKNDYAPALYTCTNFKDDEKVPEGVEIRKDIPVFLYKDYSDHQEVDEICHQNAEKVYEALRESLKDIDVVFEHDLLLQGWFLPHAMAIHRIARETSIKWFHWIHSVPSPKPADIKYPHNLRYELPPNSKLVYLNNHDILKAAEVYGLFPKDVRIVHNALDPRLFWPLHPLVKSVIEKYDLLSADFIQVYPLSTPRAMGNKQFGVVLEVMGQLKKMGKSIRIVVPNAHANNNREKEEIAEIFSYASKQGINASELIFTSLEDPPTYELGIPREAVSDFFRLSNLFIFPTTSENCSLILLEAMLSGCLLVLNDSVPSLREFGQENALYFKFGSQVENVEWDDRQTFMRDVAKIIISEFSVNKSLKVASKIKREFNYDYLFRNQIEPLLYEK